VWAGTGTGRDFRPVLNPRTRPCIPGGFVSSKIFIFAPWNQA
jgi:hypothetical protein